MVGAALEALIGEEPSEEAVAAALTTVPPAELAPTLRLLARQHGAASVRVLRACLRGRPDWAIAAADALGTVPVPAAAEALAEVEREKPPRPVRTAVRRALYRLRQTGVAPAPVAAAPSRPPAAALPRQAYLSAVDGTGSRGCWLVLEGPHGERTLLSVAINDVTGVLEFAGGPIAKKRLDERLRALHADSPLPWVEAPPEWVVHLVVEASRRHTEAGAPIPAELARWLPQLQAADSTDRAPIHDRVDAAEIARDATLIERSAGLLDLPELAGWFLDPPAVQSEALELLQARESRLVVTDQIKAERQAALLDRTIDAHLEGDARRLWQGRLEEQAFVLEQTGRPDAARAAFAVALALGDAARPARHIPFVRALAERSLEIAGEVALGRLPVEQVRRAPGARRAAAR